MLDIPTLATTLGGVLAPAIPMLIKAADAPEVADLARSVWDKLGPRLLAKPGAKDAVERAAARPDDKRVQGALELELEDVLNEDRSLAAELVQLLQDSPRGGAVNVSVSGNRSVGIGGNISGSTIITGDNQSPPPASR